MSTDTTTMSAPKTPRERWMWINRMEAAYNGRIRFLATDAPTVSVIRRHYPDDWAAVLGLREMGEDAHEVGRLLAESTAALEIVR